MYLKVLFAICISINLAKSADHTVFKECNRVDFCRNLRNRIPLIEYITLSTSLSSDFQVLTVHLQSLSNNLVLLLYGLQDNSFRLKITENNSTRYELNDVLDGDPKTLHFDGLSMSEEAFTVTTANGTNKVKIFILPFSIEFSRNDIPLAVFNGEHFTMSQNNDTAPFSFQFTFPEATQLYGIHQHCDALALRNTVGNGDPYRLKNSDVGFYEVNSTMALYGSIPVIYGHGPNSTVGFFLHNAAEQWIDTTSNENGNSHVYYMTETATLDLFVFLGPSLPEVIRQYTAITGTPHLPPLWSLGYHQSHFSYDSQEAVTNVASGFDNNNFPVDAIWLDVDYTDELKYFTWNTETFNNPLDLQKNLSSSNKKIVLIIDPHIKVDDTYKVYQEALEKNYFIKRSDGSVYQGQALAGLCSFVDFFNPDAREYFADMYSYDNFINTSPTIAGIWNDGNEPSVFDDNNERTLPPDAILNNAIKLRDAHNIYGLLHVMSTHQGLLNRDNGTIRPFILSRSQFAGSQRYTAFWTGDNQADWPYLKAEIQQCLNANLLGFVFCGADIGGFFNDPSMDLLERWYLIGTWIPFFRAHSMKGTKNREPYVLANDSQVVVRNALETRYQHLPVWYTLFYQHTTTGDPIIRPLFYHYPQELTTYKIDDEFLVGSDILVQAVTEPEVQSVDMYFPGGEEEMWISANSDDVQAGNGLINIATTRESIPVYYRKGAIIVRKDTARLNTVEMTNDTYTLYYTLDDNTEAHGEVYIDDGTSFQYRDNDNFSYYSIDIKDDNISVKQVNGNGNYSFVIDKLIQRDIIKMPQNGQPGHYKETVFETNVDGVSLREKTNILQNKFTFKF